MRGMCNSVHMRACIFLVYVRVCVNVYLGTVQSMHAHVGPNEHEGACSCELQEALLRICAWDVLRECGV